MCEIQFIKRLENNLNKNDIDKFIKLMELGSQYNNCSYGFFNENIFYKQKGEFKKDRLLQKDLFNSNFIVGHNRLSTTGDKNNNYNNHPFKYDRFSIVHNGIIHNNLELRTEFKINSKIETDSYVVLWLLNHYFNDSNKKNYIKKMTHSIRKTTDKIMGSYSVFVYDHETDNLFYFKNDKTDFSFCLDNGVLFGSTDVKNFNHLGVKSNTQKLSINSFKGGVVKIPDSEKIYLINDRVKLKEIGTFKDIEFTYDNFYPENYQTDISFNGDVDSFFHLNLGYVCGYEYNPKDQIVKVKYDKTIKKDFDEVFGDTYDIINGYMVIDLKLYNDSLTYGEF